jgi:hypothetical protein
MSTRPMDMSGWTSEDTALEEDLLSMACFLIDGGGVPPHYDTRVFVTLISEDSIFFILILTAF